MVEIIPVPACQKSRIKSKVPLDVVVGKTLDYLINHPGGITVDELAGINAIPPVTARKVLDLIAAITPKIASLVQLHRGARIRLLLTRSPKGTVAGGRLEALSSGGKPREMDEGGNSGSKPTYRMNSGDVAEIQRAWKVYKATGRAFRLEEAERFVPLCEKFPRLFSENAAKTGILPTMALFTVAKTLAEYASLGRLPEIIQTPVALITFEGDS